MVKRFPLQTKNVDAPMSPQDLDIVFMNQALLLARSAASKGEVPVGAIITLNGILISEGENSPIASLDPSAHAEIVAIRKAAKKLSNYRLPGATIYVTLEPCIMCMGAIIQARIKRLVFGATDPKTGAAGSRYSIGNDHLLNHHLEISKGICASNAADLLKDFFRERRTKVRPGTL